MPDLQFRTAAVIGTGMMGPGIAATLALGGVESTILSRTEEGAARGLDSARAQLRLLGEHGLAEPDSMTWASRHLSPSSDLETSVRNTDLAIESAPENMAFKQELFANLDRLSRPDAVLASNTSGLSITAIASRCSHPERDHPLLEPAPSDAAG